MRFFFICVFLGCSFFGCSSSDSLRDIEEAYEAYTEYDYYDYGTYREDGYEAYTEYDYYNYGAYREDSYEAYTEYDNETYREEDYLTYNFAEEIISQGDSLTDNMKKSVWRVSNPLSSNFGTALSVGPNLFVMDFYNMAEMLGDNNPIKDIVLKQDHSSSQLKVKQVIRVSALYGLIFFETEESVKNYLNISEYQPQPDDELFVLGYSRGEFKAINKTGQVIDKDNYYTFTIDHSNLDGVTGGPVLNERKQLVGIVFGSIANMLSVIKSNHLKDLMKGNIGLNCSDFINRTVCMEKEIENLKKLAKQKDALAQHSLAMIYYKGKGITQNYNLAFSWFQKSSEQGYAPSQNYIAGMYYEGKGAMQSYHLAFSWFQKSADQGYILSQHDLGIMYYKGEGIAQDFELAFEWFQKSAEQGYAPSQYFLARIYNDLEVDIESTFFWLQESAEKGYAPAQYDLGEAYYKGEGVEQDYNLAFSWFQKSADQGIVLAQIALMTMYSRAEVAEQVFKKVFDLNKKSAEKVIPLLNII